MFFTGAGRPASSKLTVFIPPTIFDRKVRSEVTANLSRIVVREQGTGDPLELPAWEAQSALIDGGVLSIGLAPAFCLPNFIQEPTPRAYDAIPQAAGECLFNDQAPVSLSWALPANAPAGDHAVPITLTYLSGKAARTCSYELVLHVRPFWERTGFQILAAASASVVIVGSAAPLISKLAAWIASVW